MIWITKEVKDKLNSMIEWIGDNVNIITALSYTTDEEDQSITLKWTVENRRDSEEEITSKEAFKNLIKAPKYIIR